MSEWGKHYGRMYEGSMVGKGAMVFAMMGYVIAKMKCKWEGNGREKVVTEGKVTLNATILSAVFGEPREEVERAIGVLCAPDKETSTEGEEGRRLVKVGQYEYRVTNAAHYQNLRDKEAEREKAAERQRKYREAREGKGVSGKWKAGEKAYEKAVNGGASDEAAAGEALRVHPLPGGGVGGPGTG